MKTVVMFRDMGVNYKVELLLNFDGNMPPKFLAYDCKLFKFNAILGGKVYLYVREDSFQNLG